MSFTPKCTRKAIKPQVGCMSILKGQRSLDWLTRTYVRDDLYQISRNCCKRPNFSFRLCYGKTSRNIQPGFFSYEQNVLVKKEGATTGILLSRWSLVTPKLSALVRIPHFFSLSANWCLQLGKLVYLLMTKQHLVSGGGGLDSAGINISYWSGPLGPNIFIFLQCCLCIFADSAFTIKFIVVWSGTAVGVGRQHRHWLQF